MRQPEHAERIDLIRYTSGTYSAHYDHWRRALQTLDEPMVLRDLGCDASGARSSVVCDLPETARAVLERISGSQDLGRLVVVLAAAQRVLAAFGKGRSIVYAIASAEGRPHVRPWVPVCLKFRMSGSIGALLIDCRDGVAASLAHQDFPVSQLLPELPPPEVAVTVGGRSLESATSPGLALAIELDGSRLRLSSPGALLDAGWLSTFGDRTIHALGEFSDTAQALAQVRLYAPELLPSIVGTGWGGAMPEDGEPDASIFDWVSARARAYPQAPALESDDGVLSYGELIEAALRVAAGLREAHGLQCGDLVAVVASRTPAWIIALLGVMAAGCVYLPVVPDQPLERLHAMLDKAEPKLVLATDRPMPALARSCIEMAELVDGLDPWEPTREPLGGDRPAYILFTSGSTGAPKGAVVGHRGFLSMIRCQIERFGMSADDRVAQIAAPSFDASLSEIFMALGCGARLVLDRGTGSRHPEQFLTALRERQVSVITLTPSHLAALEGRPLGALRALIVAGEVATAHVVRPYLGCAAVYNAYGPTEASVCATIFEVPADAPDGPLPIGRPVWNMQVYLLDAYGQPVPTGSEGEIVVAGPGVALGYLGQDSAAFMEDPWCPGRRAYRTGDRGYFDEHGRLHFRGRTDRQVKIRGYRIETAEVELALASSPAVAQVHVAVREGETPELAAWVRFRPTVELWPSIAEFYVYDDLVYSAMAEDSQRNARYRAAFERALPGKTVLEIGPGPFAVLSRMAIAAGAERVYAVEISPETANQARERIAAEGLTDRIEVIAGDIRTVQLPGPVDYCIAEIVGAIGGAEGAAVLIESAKRFMPRPERQIPARSMTRLYGVDLSGLASSLGFSDTASHYVRKIFEQIGRPFDLRLCVKNLPETALLTDGGVLEDLDYTGPLFPEHRHVTGLKVCKDGRLTGLLAALDLTLDANRPGESVDILKSAGSWLPVYLPLPGGPVGVQTGDEIALEVERVLCDNGLNVDYRLRGRLLRDGAPIAELAAHAPHVAADFRQSPFYRTIFDDAGRPLVLPSPETGLLEYCKTKLPHYMIPARIVPVSEIPLNASGKVDRHRLPDPAGARPPYRPPRNERERMATAVFESVLGVPSPGIDDDFLALGGDSIRAIQVAARLADLGYSVSSTAILQYRTAAEIAPNMTARRETDRGPRSGSFPLAPIQRWFLERASPRARHHFNLAVMLRGARLDPRGVAETLQTLVRCHDLLRSRFKDMSALVLPDERVSEIPVVTLGYDDLPVACDEVQSSLNIETGPLFRVAIFRLPDADRLLFAVHHIVIDWVSWRVLLEDLQRGYGAWQRGEPIVPGARTSSYLDWALAMETEARGPLPAGESDYWSSAIAAARRACPDQPASAGACATVREDWTLAVALDPQTTAGLLDAANRAYNTEAQDLMLVALQECWNALEPGAALSLVLESHGRGAGPRTLDLSRTLGWFTTFYPIVLEPSPERDLGSRIKRLKEQLRAVPRNGVGYLTHYRDADAPAHLAFNYLGRTDEPLENGPSAAGGAVALSFAEEPVGRLVHAETFRPAWMALSLSVADGRLHVYLEIDRAWRSQDWGQRLGEGFLRSLGTVVDYCVSRESSEITASDLSYAELGEEGLEALFADRSEGDHA